MYPTLTNTAHSVISVSGKKMFHSAFKTIKKLLIYGGIASSRDHNDIGSVTAEADKNMYKCKRDYYMSIGSDKK